MDEKIVIPQETSDMMLRFAANKRRTEMRDSMENLSRLMGGDENPFTAASMDMINSIPDSAFIDIPEADREAMAIFKKLEGAESLDAAMEINAEMLLKLADTGDPSIRAGLQSFLDLFQLILDTRSTQSIRDMIANIPDETAVNSLSALLDMAETLLEIIPEDAEIDLKTLLSGLGF